MHLKRAKYYYKGEKREYAQIIESYRDEKGRPRQRLLKNLWRIRSEEDWEKAKRYFEKIRLGRKFLMLEDIEIEEQLDYGVLYVCQKLWDGLGMSRIFEKLQHKNKDRLEKIIPLLIFNRLSDPGSELNCFEWVKRNWFEEKYKTVIGEQNLYRTLDFLTKNKEKIEKEIFQLLKDEIGPIRFVLYDLTSSYFESRNESELKKFGYSRDKIKGKRQILLGLVIANEMPIAHFLFPGNVADKKTIKQTVEYLQENFGIKNVVYVADRGTVSRYNLQYLEENGFDYIFSTKRRKNGLIRELILKEINGNAEEVYKEGKKRYILCFNEEKRVEDLEEIEFTIKEFQEILSKNRRIALARRNLRPTLKRLFDANGELREEVYKFERSIAGKFLLVTTTSLTPEECYKEYKQLADVERSFREIKSFLKVRPFYHRTDGRIRGHVFVCFFAYLFECLLRKKLNYPVRKVLRELEMLRIAVINIEGEKIGILSKLGKQQEHILSSLGIEKPPTMLKI